MYKRQVLGESDKRLSGLKVYALDADGQTVATATTNGRGEYLSLIHI